MRLFTLSALTAASLLLSTAAESSAGPLRDRLAARRSCGQVARPVAFRPAAALAPAVARPVTAGGCSGGACPAVRR